MLCYALMMASVASAASTGKTPQTFLREPFDQMAAVGEHVTLPCRVAHKHGVLQWTRDDFGLGTDRGLQGFKRYSMTGSDEEGDYTLDINPVSLEDDGRFQCQVGAADGVSPIRSRYATLSVLVRPDPPAILPMGDTFKTVEGRDVELRCLSNGGKPAAEITWLDSDNSVIRDGVHTTHELQDDGKRFNTVSVLRFAARLEHDGRNVTCQAQNTADRQPHTATIRLVVHYPPHVSLTSNRQHLQEGDNVRFRCVAKANPDAQMAFVWFVGDRRVGAEGAGEVSAAEATGTAVSELVLDSVDRRLHNQAVRCEVANAIGRSEESTMLDVAYSPVFLTRPDHAAGMTGESTTLRCVVDSNPKPSYAWYHYHAAGREPRLVGTAPNLTLVVDANTAGEYECRASVPGHTFVSASAVVHLKGAPRIVAGNEGFVQHAADTGDVSIVCQAFTVPKAETVEWSFNGHRLRTDGSGRFAAAENRSADGIRSTLTIKSVEDADFGPYVCSVANVLGADSAVIQLKKQTSMPLVVIVAGVIGGAILTLAVVLVVVLCRRNLSASSAVAKKLAPEIVSVAVKKTSQGEAQNQQLATQHQHQLHHQQQVHLATLSQKPSSSTTTTTASSSSSTSSTASSDRVSNESAELKVEVRTSSSLSEHAHAQQLQEDSFEGSDYGGTAGSRLLLQKAAADYVDGLMPGLPRGFQPQTYGSSSYGGHHTLGSVNHGYGGSYNPVYSHTYHNVDSPGRYSVHVRASPISPANSGISVRNSMGVGVGYDNFHSYSNLDYVPASAYSRSPQPQLRNASAVDNYSVYVNGGPRHGGHGGLGGSGHHVSSMHHEMLGPSSSASSSNGSGVTTSTTAIAVSAGLGLATHV